jgi:hypothetical protein
MTDKDIQLTAPGRDPRQDLLMALSIIRLRTLVCYLKVRKLALYIAWRVVRLIHDGTCDYEDSAGQRES